MEKYLITSWNATTPSKRERERKKERERETFQKDERLHFFVAFECKVRAVVERKYSRGMKDMCDVVLIQLFYEQKERHFFSISQARENEKDFSPFRKAEKGGKMARGGICIHTSRIYIDSSALQVLLLLFIVAVGVVLVVLKHVRSAICVYVYSIAFVLAWCVYIISS